MQRVICESSPLLRLKVRRDEGESELSLDNLSVKTPPMATGGLAIIGVRDNFRVEFKCESSPVAEKLIR